MDEQPNWSVHPGEQPPPRPGGWAPSPPPSSGPGSAPPFPPAPGRSWGDGPPTVFTEGPSTSVFTSDPAPAPPPPRHRSRIGRVVAAGAVTALAFTGIGYAGGQLVNDDGGALGATSTTVTSPAPLNGDEEEPVAAIARVLSPAVVQIETRDGLGSGFVYDEEGHILTAAHVVETAEDVVVRLADGSSLDGTVVGTDTSTDVAVVQVDAEGKDLPVAELATGVKIEVGQLAVAIGSPFGLDQTVTSGIISAVGRTVTTRDGAVPMLQTDAAINTGNSGGALADRFGRVIGINDQIATASEGGGGNVGVGFAIPIDTAKSVADRIVAGDPLDTGFLGVSTTEASREAGATVVEVTSGSPADDAGIQRGDVIVALGDARIGGVTDLLAAVRSHAPGDEVTVTIQRGDDERELEVTLAKSTR